MMKMLAYILDQTPRYISADYCQHLLPLVSDTKYIVNNKNGLMFVNIAQYFALIECERLFHYCILQRPTLVTQGFLCVSNEAFIKMFINLDYTQFNATKVVNIIRHEERSHHILEPLVRQLLKYHKHPVVNYTYLSNCKLDYSIRLFDLIDLPKEINHILSLVDTYKARDLCDEFIGTCAVFGNRLRGMDKSTLANILSHVSPKKCKKDIFYILYTIAYDEPYLSSVETNNAAIVFIQRLYGKSYAVMNSMNYGDIVHLEPLLATEDSKLLLIDMLRCCNDSLFDRSPNIHEVLIRASIKYSRVFNVKIDNCKYCQCITQL